MSDSSSNSFVFPPGRPTFFSLCVLPSSLMDPSGHPTPASSSADPSFLLFGSGESLSNHLTAVHDNLCKPTPNSNATYWLMTGTLALAAAAHGTKTKINNKEITELCSAVHDYNSLQSFRETTFSGNATESELKATMGDMNDPDMKNCAEQSFRAWEKYTSDEMSPLMLQSLLSCHELHPGQTHFGYQSSMDPSFTHNLSRFEQALEAHRKPSHITEVSEVDESSGVESLIGGVEDG
ncbi:hypothetical protein BCR39DRAFT_507848 [Naematelia encephala]|uniref:Uncharacterized protein n=1 Tax=Naematelia encephala TaxID=71784 RepID=A0A1Y2ALB7_9TREE|nr:hypothetical protein BCR39DRAFT_507848 [Naematelia encephala]